MQLILLQGIYSPYMLVYNLITNDYITVCIFFQLPRYFYVKPQLVLFKPTGNIQAVHQG